MLKRLFASVEKDRQTRTTSGLLTLIYASLFVLVTNSAGAQSAGIEFNVGQGRYQMNNLKKYISTYKANAALDLREVEMFPDEVNIGGAFVVGIDRVELGVDYRHFRSRALLTNTSSNQETGLDLGLSANAMGLFLKYAIVQTRFFHFKIGVSGDVYGSKMLHKEYVSTSSSYDKTTEKLRSYSFAAQGFAEPVIYFTQGVYAGVRVGYVRDFQGSLDRYFQRGKFMDPNGEKVYTEWTGIRSEVFLGFRLNP